MTSRIFRSISSVAIAVFLASLVLIMGVLYDYFSGTQMTRLRSETELVADAVEISGANYLRSLDATDDDLRITWIQPDGSVTYDNKADTKMFVEFDNEAGTTGITLSVPNELFDKLGIKKKEKYTKATEEKVKAVLNVLAKGYNLNIKALLHRKSVVDKEGEFEIALELFLIIGVIAVVKEAYDEDKKKRKIRAHLRYWKIP